MPIDRRHFNLAALGGLGATLSSPARAEDKVTIEAQQRAIEEDRAGPPLRAVSADKASLAVRRVIKRHLNYQLAQEAEHAPESGAALRAAP